jgi:SHS2 domain-containing protein
MKFKFLEFSTADVCYMAYGNDLNMLYENAALAMFEVMINTDQVGEKIIKEIEVDGFDLKSLMFNWLNELLFLYDSENLTFSRFDIQIDEDRMRLKAKILGEEIDIERHEIRADVKACTYHCMEIRRIDDGYYAQILLDV